MFGDPNCQKMCGLSKKKPRCMCIISDVAVGLRPCLSSCHVFLVQGFCIGGFGFTSTSTESSLRMRYLD